MTRPKRNHHTTSDRPTGAARRAVTKTSSPTWCAKHDKRKYTSRAQALKAGEQKYGARSNAYLCSCGSWHLTRRNKGQALFDKMAKAIGPRTVALFTFAILIGASVPLAIALGSIWSAPALTAGILATVLLWRVLCAVQRSGAMLRRSQSRWN